jgi:MFS superfamily sulfate permease-like transporter
MKTESNKFIENLRYDLPASIVVFFVAVPLCLGISLASGAPLLSGLIAGTIGGIVVGFLSGSPISVSGPAAGLTSIVLTAIGDLGSFQAFALAVVLAGIFQILLGYLNAGVIGYFFPSSVIKGMLAGIGIILILKQIPHALGDDADFEGDESFIQPDSQNTFTEIFQSLQHFSDGAVVISILSMAVLLLWSHPKFTKAKFLNLLPGPLAAVAIGVSLNILFQKMGWSLALTPDNLVDLPDLSAASFTLPDWNSLSNPIVYQVAATIALVASIETLLSIEAADKMDPYKRLTPLNRELKAQGTANAISGLLGGLPVTSVIVRTTTNVSSGARTKYSTIMHGTLIALSVALFPVALEYIPLSSLAAILILVGYKLTSPSLWRAMWAKGIDQFLPFAITSITIVLTNLLVGIGVGIVVALIFVLRSNYHSAMLKVNRENQFLIKFTKDASFLNKTPLVRTLESIPPGSNVLIEGSTVQFFDHDIIEIISEFEQSAPTKEIKVEIRRTANAVHPFFKSTTS